MVLKNNNIQIIRALAIIAVVMIHTSPSGLGQVIIRPFVNYAVAVFLFLSGYLTNINCSNWKSFYNKRIFRVLVPYVIWSTIYYAYNSVFNGFSIKEYIYCLLTTKATYTLYYIYVYIEFVVLTPLIGKLAKTKYYWTGLLITPLTLIIKYYWLISNSEPNKYISLIWDISCLGWFSFYYLGILLGNDLIKKQFNIRKLFLLYGLSIIIQITEGYAWYKLGENNCGTQLKYSSLITSMIFIFICYYYLNKDVLIKNKTINKLLIIIGDYSFGVYLIHPLIISLLSRINIWTQIPFGINSIITLAISLMCVALFNTILGKKYCKLLGMC